MTQAERAISEEEWAWVQGMIRDLVREESRDLFLKSLFQWDMGVREFRKVEMKRIIHGEPSARDLENHAICLHILLAIGRSVAAASRDFTTEELAENRVSHDQIEAYVQELEQSYREWHHGLTDKEVEEAERKIFGAAA